MFDNYTYNKLLNEIFSMRKHSCQSGESNKLDNMSNMTNPNPVNPSSPLVRTRCRFKVEIIGSQGKPPEHSPLKYLISKKNK